MSDRRFNARWRMAYNAARVRAERERDPRKPDVKLDVRKGVHSS